MRHTAARQHHRDLCDGAQRNSVLSKYEDWNAILTHSSRTIHLDIEGLPKLRLAE